MMEELKPCPFCESVDKKSANAIYSFGKDFSDDRPEGSMAFCLRHSAGSYVLHAEAIDIDDSGKEWANMKETLKSIIALFAVNHLSAAQSRKSNCNSLFNAA